MKKIIAILVLALTLAGGIAGSAFARDRSYRYRSGRRYRSHYYGGGRRYRSHYYGRYRRYRSRRSYYYDYYPSYHDYSHSSCCVSSGRYWY